VVAARVATRRAARPATTSAAPASTATATETAQPSASPAPSAESLFEAANRARIRRDYDAAVVAYLRLQYRYPTSREARVSFVTMGRMQLDRADAAGALLSFERYERSGDVELADLAMAGRALALDDIGSDIAPAVWLALLAAHPDSPYASHARLRARAARSLL
jgi:TolA-binding protein